MITDKSEIERLSREFSDEFDVLFNNISSNQAPGLDQYEKSLFLTRAQDDIVKGYFTPYLNKIQAGYDDNERRQIDFSMITNSKTYENKRIPVKILSGVMADNSKWEIFPFTVKEGFKTKYALGFTADGFEIAPLRTASGNPTTEDIVNEFVEALIGNHPVEIEETFSNSAWVYISTFCNPVFDLRDNTRTVIVEDDILMVINEYVTVERDSKKTRLTVLPITYTEYSRVMAKPYKRPVKNQAWKLIDSTDGVRKSEIIVGPTDILQEYVIRYIKRPCAIVLEDFGTEANHDVSINGCYKQQACELDPILYHEIIQKGVELAWAAYKEPSLSNMVSMGQSSQTPLGAVQTNSRRDER